MQEDKTSRIGHLNVGGLEALEGVEDGAVPRAATHVAVQVTLQLVWRVLGAGLSQPVE